MLQSEILEDFISAKEKIEEVVELLSIEPNEIEDYIINYLQQEASAYASDSLREVGKAIKRLEGLISETEKVWIKQLFYKGIYYAILDSKKT